MIDLVRRALLLSAGALALRPILGVSAAVAAEIDPSAAVSYPYAVPALGYGYDACEPAIDAMTMQIHHDKHHAAYVNNLNAALKDHAELQKKPLAELLTQIGEAPEAIRTAVRNQGGGHANHTMFWQILGGKGGEPDGELKAAIESDFGGFDKLKTAMNQAALKVFGSGWATVAMADGKLTLVSHVNQDSLWMDHKTPLFGIDVWEHAYYLKYQNRRADYVNAFWTVLNWSAIGKRYAAAKAGTLAI